jgi:signal peptidase II
VSLRDVSLIALLLDQATKYWVAATYPLNEPVTIIPNYLYLTHIHNPGAAFGFLAGTDPAIRIPLFLAITVGAGLVIYSLQRFVPPERKWVRAALGLIWGGALGNFVDRVRYGKVVDFIDARYHDFHWYVFNVADSCITVGLILLVATYGAGEKRGLERRS